MYDFLLLMIRSFLEGFPAVCSHHLTPHQLLHIISHIASEEPLFPIRVIFEVRSTWRLRRLYVRITTLVGFLKWASTRRRLRLWMLNGDVMCHYCTYSNKRFYMSDAYIGLGHSANCLIWTIKVENTFACGVVRPDGSPISKLSLSPEMKVLVLSGIEYR